MTMVDQRIADIPLRSGELAALRQLLEFVQATEASDGPGDLARQLIMDLDARAKKDSPNREISRHAVEYAVNERARLAELRRRD